VHILGPAVRGSAFVKVKRLLLLVFIMELMARGPSAVVILICFVCSFSCPRQGELLKNPEFLLYFSNIKFPVIICLDAVLIGCSMFKVEGPVRTNFRELGMIGSRIFMELAHASYNSC
jgi:hypothetical protein